VITRASERLPLKKTHSAAQQQPSTRRVARRASQKLGRIAHPKTHKSRENFDKKKFRRELWPPTSGRSVQPSGRIHQSKAKSQRIAAWELLYRVQHPGRYVSRLQTILHSDIAVKIPRHEDDRHSTKHHCDGSFFRPSSESGSAAVNEDQIHGPYINRLP
jgi:hypothetical protein